MTPIINMGRILRDVYEQHQRGAQQPTPEKPDIPRLVGGLWAAFGFEEAAAKYRQRLEEQYGYLQILGHHRPVPLDGVFTDVYLYDRPLANRRLTAKDLEDQFRQGGIDLKGAKRIDGLSLVQQERRLVILGRPGAGKTTFLKHITLKVARGELPGVPIFISLKALADSPKLILDFMVREMEICGFPEPAPFLLLMLEMGRIVILLDGMDEVSQAQESSHQMMQGIENFARQYSNNHFLITCRTGASEYQFPGFTYVEMADFNSEQVTLFINKWFQYKFTQGDYCIRELHRPEHKGLRDLARTPLLLNLLCLTYEELGHFPKRRVELYEEALSALLSKWDNSRRIRREEAYRKLSLGRKRQMLTKIAESTFLKGQYLIPKQELAYQIATYLHNVPPVEETDEIDGEAILRAIEAHHGILVKWGQNVYVFAHISFQEYFTAKYIVENVTTALPGLMNHLTSAYWHEVFILTVAMLDEAETFFEWFFLHLDAVLDKSPVILSVLAWADLKSRAITNSPTLLPLLRITYLILVLGFDFKLDYIRIMLSGLIYRLDNSQAFVLHDAIKLILNIDFDLSTDFDVAPDLDYALALALHNETLDRFLSIDISLAYALLLAHVKVVGQVYEYSIILSKQLGLVDLAKELQAIPLPSSESEQGDWTRFTGLLKQTFGNQRNFRLWEISEGEIPLLKEYIDSNYLLVDCLEQAYLKNRAAIEMRILQPLATDRG